MTGKIKWFNTDRYFGIIEQDNGRGEIFVHWSDIEGMASMEELAEGLSVFFDVAEDESDHKAVNVRRLDVQLSIEVSRSLRNRVAEAAKIKNEDFASAVYIALDEWAHRILADDESQEGMVLHQEKL